MPFGAFQPLKPAPGGPATIFPWAYNKDCTINPEFKDLAQTWGWKMITADEKMYP
jgi:hypothetical protein